MSGFHEDKEMCAAPQLSPMNKTYSSYNLKRTKKKKKKLNSRKGITTAWWKQMRYYNWDAVIGLCVILLQLSTNRFL